MTKRPKIIVILDVDGSLYDRRDLGFLIDGVEKIFKLKEKFLNHQQSTNNCLAAGNQGWARSTHSFLTTIRRNPNVRAIGKPIHRIAMNVLFQCAENSKLAEALSELSNNPDVGIVFLTNGPGGHARNTVRTVLTEEVLKSLFGFNYSDKNIILTKNLSHKKPDSRAFQEALQLTMTTMEISLQEEISKIFVVDDNPENLEGAKKAFGDKVECIHITRSQGSEFSTCPNMVDAVNKIVSFCTQQKQATR